jgi:hypothetical protein
MGIETAWHGRGVPWGDVLLSAVAAVSWALIGMAGTAALGLHLLEADSAGSLGPMTAAVVALGAGGSVTPSGDVSAFGLKGAEATTALQITPLGVGLVGALLLSWFFLRSLRGAGVVIAPSELLARAGAVVALFVATLGGLAWAGHDVITIDGGKLGLDKVPDGGLGDITDKLPGGLGDIGGLLPDKIGDLVNAEAAVGFTVDTARTLLGGLVWAVGVLVIALLASRRTPLPRGWEAVHRTVRPAASALVAVLLMAVVAGLAAAAYAAVGDDHPKRIAGAALLGAPNGVWLGIPVGLLVPWDGKATGELAKLLPDPLDELLSVRSDQPVTLGRLAELDGRVWLLGVAAAVMMLFAGVLAATRTPLVRRLRDAGAGEPGVPVVRGPGALPFAGRCALRLAAVTALALPLLAWLTDVSADASLSVLGFDAFGAGIELHGHLGMALLLGAVWGAGAGGVGALLAYASGAAGRLVAPLARPVALGDAGAPGSGLLPEQAGEPGPYHPAQPFRPANPDTNPYLRVPDELREPEDARPAEGSGWRGRARTQTGGSGAEGGGPPQSGGSGPAGGKWPQPQGPGPGDRSGPARGASSPERQGSGGGAGVGQGPGDGRGSRGGPGSGGGRGSESGQGSERGQGSAPGARPPQDVYGAPTVIGPVAPAPRPPRQRPGARGGDLPPPPPPPPPPPAPPPEEGPPPPRGRRGRE